MDIELQLSVTALLTRYVRTIDDDRLEEWPAMFTERCLYKVTTAENQAQGLPAGIIFCNSRGMLQDRVLSLRQANIYEAQRYRHLVSGVQVLRRDGGMVEVEADFLVVRTTQSGNTVLFCAGRYHDRIVLRGDTPLFEQKIVVCDSSRTDTLLAIPL